MSAKLLQEYFELCPDGQCAFDVLTESERKRVANDGAVYLVGVCQRAGTKNGNGRIYKKETLEREVRNYQKAIKERRSLGELDHPDDSVINLKNASHLVAKMWWDGENVMGKIEVLGTPSGRILKDLVKAGVKLGISSRGLGTVKEGLHGTVMVEDDFQLICFDIVSEPSTPGAYLAPKASVSVSTPQMDVGINAYLNENKEKTNLNNLIQDILKD
jgi:hypothetical protein